MLSLQLLTQRRRRLSRIYVISRVGNGTGQLQQSEPVRKKEDEAILINQEYDRYAMTICDSGIEASKPATRPSITRVAQVSLCLL